MLRDSFLEGMSRAATTVNVVTTDGPGGRAGDKFAAASWRRLATGAPALDDALVAFDCAVMKEIDWGTHTVFIADVVDIELAEPGRPLIYAGRAYGVPRLQGEAAA